LLAVGPTTIGRLFLNKSVFSLVNSAVNTALSAFAADQNPTPFCGAIAVGRYLLPARLSAANPPHAAAAVE